MTQKLSVFKQTHFKLIQTKSLFDSMRGTVLRTRKGLINNSHTHTQSFRLQWCTDTHRQRDKWVCSLWQR